MLCFETFATIKDVPFSDAWCIRYKWVFRPIGAFRIVIYNLCSRFLQNDLLLMYRQSLRPWSQSVSSRVGPRTVRRLCGAFSYWNWTVSGVFGPESDVRVDGCVIEICGCNGQNLE